MPRAEITFLIPLRENPRIGEGALHPQIRWELLKDALFSAFGVGATWPPDVRGIWEEPETGEIVEGESKVFQIDVDDDRLEDLRSILRRACRTFCQRSIRVVIRGEVEYLEAGPDDPPL